MEETCAHHACRRPPDKRCPPCLEPFCADHWERSPWLLRTAYEDRYCNLCLEDAARAPSPRVNQEIYYGTIHSRARVLGQRVERRPRCPNCRFPLMQTDLEDQLLCQSCGGMYARTDYLRVCRRPLWAEA